MTNRVCAAIAAAVLVAGCRSEPPAPAPAPAPGPVRSEVVVVGERALALGAPLVHENLAIFLLTGDSTDDREFLTLDQGLAAGSVVVAEKGAGAGEDQAEVNELVLDNRSDLWLFLQAGDVVRGGKQDRAVAQDVVVPPRSGPRPLAAFCVEQGRWSSGGGGGAAGAGHAAPNFIFVSNTALVNSVDLKRAIQAERSQEGVWREVAAAADDINLQPSGGGAFSLPDTGTYNALVEDPDLSKRRDAYAAALLGKVRAPKGAVGMAVAINGEVVGAECYASPGLFRAMAKKLVESYALDALAAKGRARAGTSAPSPDGVRTFVASARGRAGREDSLPGNMRRFVIDGDVLVGFEYRCLNGKGQGEETSIHASYLRK